MEPFSVALTRVFRPRIFCGSTAAFLESYRSTKLRKALVYQPEIDRSGRHRTQRRVCCGETGTCLHGVCRRCGSDVSLLDPVPAGMRTWRAPTDPCYPPAVSLTSRTLAVPITVRSVAFDDLLAGEGLAGGPVTAYGVLAGRYGNDETIAVSS
jgi:hypothetical protein